MVGLPAGRTKLTPPQIAKRFGIDVNKILGWIRSGELRAINGARKANGTKPRFLVDVADLEAFERSRQVSPPPAPAPRARRSKPSDVIQYY